ncbi:MAG: hypothetical protein ACPL3P_04525 [Anaerolineales bacterium]
MEKSLFPPIRFLQRYGFLLLIVLGYIGQVSFGYISGRGFESLRLKYADSS